MSPYWILLSGISFCLNCLFVIPNRISISKEIRFNGNNSFVAFFSKLLSSLSSLYQPKGSLLVIVLPQTSPSTPTLRYPHPSQRLQVRCRPSQDSLNRPILRHLHPTCSCDSNQVDVSSRWRPKRHCVFQSLDDIWKISYELSYFFLFVILVNIICFIISIQFDVSFH